MKSCRRCSCTLRLPLPHLACRRSLPVDSALVRGAVELMNQTLVVPDLNPLSVPGLVL